MKQSKEQKGLTGVPKMSEKSREEQVMRQSYFLVEINQLIKKRIKQDKLTTVDIIGVMNLALAKLAIDSLRPEKEEDKSENIPSYLG